jgi:hypothetical protein
MDVGKRWKKGKEGEGMMHSMVREERSWGGGILERLQVARQKIETKRVEKGENK